jgi:hypothetical protein
MGHHYGQLCCRVSDSMEKYGFTKTLSRFGQIYDNGCYRYELTEGGGGGVNQLV